MAEHFTLTRASLFVLRILGISSEGLKDRVRWYLRYTATRVEAMGAGEWDPWVYTDQVLVTGVEQVKNPLDSLHTKLGLLRRAATTCLQCGGGVAHYCAACLAASYCSQACQVEHWEEGHSEECDSHLHGTAGLSPPIPGWGIKVVCGRM